MRTLQYKVTGQRLRPIGDHTGLVAGTEGYLKASFVFDSSWDGCKIVASFSPDGHNATVLEKDGTCVIPAKALIGSTFEVRAEGRRDNYSIRTNPVIERQSGGVSDANS